MKYLKWLGYAFILPVFYWASLQTILDTINLINLKYGRLTAVGNAVMLDITVSSPADFAPPITPETKAQRSFTVNKNTDIPFVYDVAVKNPAGSLCSYLKLTADINEKKGAYAGRIDDLKITAQPGAGQDEWHLSAVLTSDDPGLQNSICLFDLEFSGQDQATGESNKEIAVIHNVVKSGTWIDGYEPKPGDVIVNEVMWMGSAVSPDDEWIELKNMTAKTIDLSGWKITNLHGSGSNFIFPQNTYLDPGSFFVIAKTESASVKTALAIKAGIQDPKMVLLNNYNPQLVLEDSVGTAIDRVGGGTWLAGSDGEKKRSMERNEKPGSGLFRKDWHSCEGSFTDSDLFWLEPGQNNGTPGAVNSGFNAPIGYDKETFDTDVPARKQTLVPVKNTLPHSKQEKPDTPINNNPVMIDSNPFPILEPMPQPMPPVKNTEPARTESARSLGSEVSLFPELKKP